MLLQISPEILDSAKQGNLAAFEHIVSTFERPLFSYLYRLCGHRQTAEDLLQDTFVKVYKNVRKIRPDQNFKSWVFTIATNTAYDFLRKKKHVIESFIIDDPDSNFETIEAEHAYTIVEKLDAKKDVDKALDEIKPQYRTVLLLFYQEDLSYESIARVLQIPVNTVKTYLHRAKLALKGRLGPVE